MKLTENFTLEEFIRTSHKVRNVPNSDEIANLKILCEKCMQPIRNEFGAVSIKSGFRNPILNRLVGGSPTSQHLKGEACDFKVKNMQECFNWIRENLEFDQLINEYDLSWIHISFRKNKNRKEVLKAVKISGKTVYLPI